MLHPTDKNKSLLKARLLLLILLFFSAEWAINSVSAQSTSSPYNKSISGCLDVKATNYNPTANIQAKDEYDNLRCTYASCDDIPSDGCLYTNSFSEWNDFFGPKDCENYGGGHAYRDVWMKMQPTSMQRQLFNPKTTMETFYVSMRHARRHHMMGVFTSNHSARIAKVLAMNPVQALVE
jgi:hypothetical protein